MDGVPPIRRILWVPKSDLVIVATENGEVYAYDISRFLAKPGN